MLESAIHEFMKRYQLPGIFRVNDIASALKRDNYQGVVSLESVYHPDNGSYEDGFREYLPEFLKLFGD